MTDYEEAMALLSQIKEIAIEVNDERKVQLLDYIQEMLWRYEDMRNS
jgi:hypothetical protein